MEFSSESSRRLPGETKEDMGNAASYSPNPDDHDSLDSVFITPAVSSQSVTTRPVMTNYRSVAGSSPDEIDTSGRPRPDLGRMSQVQQRRRKEWWTKPKMMMVGGALLIILLLVIILPVALTLQHRNAASQQDLSNSTNEHSLSSSSAALTNLNTGAIASDSEWKDIGLDLKNPEESETLGSTATDLDQIFKPLLRNASHFQLKPPPVANCSKDVGFICSEDGSGIGLQFVCDGAYHCPRGSDESNCSVCATSLWCDVGSVEGAPKESASTARKCLRAERLCDSVRDCLDGRDEDLYCSMAACGEGMYQCEGEGVSVCVEKEWLCDGDAHCPFGDDEKDCDGSCTGGAVWCDTSRMCIPPFQICDGYPNCQGGSDEAHCNCSSCQGPDSILCRQPSQAEPHSICIARAQLCDTALDCPGGEDEMNCPGWCPIDAVAATKKCSDGVVYPLRYACSGLVPACDSICVSCDPEIAFTCNEPGNGPRCIPRRGLCDGIRQCANGEDESNDTCSCEGEGPLAPFRCPPTLEEMRLGVSLMKHTKCIPSTYRCDGFMDCPDGSDERECSGGCGNVAPGMVSFYCKQTKDCFPSTARCDGVPDCPDFSDEDGCDCTQCKSQSYPTYMCQAQGRCLKASFICNPNAPAHCPPTADGVTIDQAHCSPLFDPLSPSRW